MMNLDEAKRLARIIGYADSACMTSGSSTTFVVVKKSSDTASLRYHLPSGASVKHIDADMLKRANAKSGVAIRSAIAKIKNRMSPPLTN